MFSAIAGAVTVALVLFLWLGQRRLLYLPLASLHSPDVLGLADTRTLSLTTADGLTLGAWDVPPSGGRAPRAVVLVFNGNAGNRTYRAPIARRLSLAGYRTVLVDYRGYGGNPGRPSEEGLIADARAARRAVESDPGVPVVYFGESLGTGVAVRLAVEHPPAALVLRSPFTSITDVAAHHYWFLPVRRLLWDRFDSLARIGDVRAPLLVVAGDRDSVVPYALSARLYEAAREPKRFVTVPGADHNDAALAADAPMLDAVVAFLREELAR